MKEQTKTVIVSLYLCVLYGSTRLELLWNGYGYGIPTINQTVTKIAAADSRVSPTYEHCRSKSNLTSYDVHLSNVIAHVIEVHQDYP